MITPNRLKRFIIGASLNCDDGLLRRRLLVLRLFSFAILLTSCTMLGIAAMKGNVLLVLINTVVALHIFHNFYLIRSIKWIKLKMIWITSISALLLLILYGVTEFGEMLFVWTILFPLYAVSVNGGKVGSRFFGIFFAAIIAITLIERKYDPIGIVQVLRYLITVLLAYFFAFFMEETNQNEHRLLEQSKLELEVAHRDLQELTIRDSLTGLHNRRYLDDILPLVISQCRRYSAEVALIMIDVDFFKKYNDHYGHQAGDSALRAVAQALQSAVRRETDYICRYGGEEFILIMNKSTADAADACVARIQKQLSDASIPHLYGIDERITVSMGMTTLDLVGIDTKESFIERADKALYEAKRLGRNRVCKL